MILQTMPPLLAICRLDAGSDVPAWAMRGGFFSITRTSDELSIACEQANVPAGVKAELKWRCLKVQGPLDFGLTGILAALATPLAQAGISIFAISTFDTDYLLVKEATFAQAVETLLKAGHEVRA